jgi:hypothetical protein
MFKPSNDRKAGSAVTRSAFSIMAWAPSTRSKGSLWRNGNSPQELFLRTLRAVVRSLEIEQGPITMNSRATLHHDAIGCSAARLLSHLFGLSRLGRLTPESTATKLRRLCGRIASGRSDDARPCEKAWLSSRARNAPSPGVAPARSFLLKRRPRRSLEPGIALPSRDDLLRGSRSAQWPLWNRYLGNPDWRPRVL